MRAILVLLLALAAPAWACPFNFVTDYGADPTGAFDNVAAWNDAMAAQDDCLYIPSGTYIFLSPPDPVLHALAITGDTAINSRLVRAYNNGRFIDVQGASGGRLAHLAIIAEQGTTGGIGLRFEVGTSGAPHAWQLEHLRITGHGNPYGTFFWPLYALGGSNNGISGWRNSYIHDVTLFGHEAGTFYCQSCKSLRIVGLTTYGAMPKVWFVDGAGGVTTRITMVGVDLQGPIQINGAIAASSWLGSWTKF